MWLGCPLSIIIIDEEEEKVTLYLRVWLWSTNQVSETGN